MSDKAINDAGLARILTNLKANFATKDELQNAGGGGSVSYMSDQEVIDILNDDEEAWTGLEKVKTLWENASPTSAFASQTITLSDAAANYDFIIIFSKFTNESGAPLVSIILKYDENSSGFSMPISTYGNYGGGREGSFITSNYGLQIQFGGGSFNKSTSRNDVLIPYKIYGINL